MKLPPRPRKDKRVKPPWIDEELPLELYVSPAIKERLGLNLKTTADYLAAQKRDDAPEEQSR